MTLDKELSRLSQWYPDAQACREAIESNNARFVACHAQARQGIDEENANLARLIEQYETNA